MLIFIMLMLVMMSMTVLADTLIIEVDTANATVEIQVGSMGYSNYKAIIQKGDQKYIYNLISDVEVLPLQLGSGEYTISILGSKDGRRFRTFSKKTVNVELDEMAVFLSSSQTINWSDESEVAILALELTEDAKTDLEKLELIHDYVVNNMTYDYDKAESLPAGYIPNPEASLEDESGICYDFASLTAAMLRSVDIPTKLIKGYSAYTPVYHAWNEVYIDDQWIVVDTSTDAVFNQNNVKYTLEKSADDYMTSKIY